MGKTPNKKIVFILDEHGRTLTKQSMHKLLSELFDKALKEQNVDAVVASGPTINTCAYLSDQIAGREIAEWEIIYLHGSKYPGRMGEQDAKRPTSPPVLLTHEDKESLIAMLPTFSGTSAEAVYKVLMDSWAFNQFD